MPPVDLTLDEDECLLLNLMFVMDRSDEWLERNAWSGLLPQLEARKLIFRYTANNGLAKWSLSSYGCDAVRANKSIQQETK